MTTVAQRPAEAAATHRGARHIPYVPALDGVRGLAVLAVIAYHLTQTTLQGVGSRLPEFAGGFLGVDLFFVLSGFLITRLLLAEQADTGRIDVVQFWLRRARRLLPALLLLLAVVAVASAWSSPLVKGARRWDVLASLGYAVNWRFVVTGQSYFDTLVTPSPVRHLWSLAIEEQFYVLWPLLVTLALAVLGRSGARARSTERRDKRRIRLVLLIAIVASAVVLAISYRAADPSRAYYGTDARAHELLIGALAAILTHRHPGVRGRGGLALVGLAGTAGLTLVLTDHGAGYYRGGSVVFSGAAAVLIVGVAGGRSPIARCLEYGPLVYVGTISYGLYLWHWPVILWLSQDRTGLSGPWLAVIRCGTTLTVALLSYYLIEQPVRTGSLRRLADVPRTALVSAGCCALVIVAATLLTTRGAQSPPADLTATPRVQVAGPGQSHGLRPIALIGDSVARNFGDVFQAKATSLGRASFAIGFGGCATGDLQYVHGDGKNLYGNPPDFCFVQHYKVWTAKVVEMRPEIVFIHSRRDGYDLMVNGRHLLAGTPEWLAATEAEWDRILHFLVDHGTTAVVVILPMYVTGEKPGCESGRPAEARTLRCGASTDGFMGVGPLRAAYRHWAAGHDKTHDNLVRVVDPSPWVCPSPQRACPKLVAGRPMRIPDGIHFTQEGDRWIVPKIFEASGLFGTA